MLSDTIDLNKTSNEIKAEVLRLHKEVRMPGDGNQNFMVHKFFAFTREEILTGVVITSQAEYTRKFFKTIRKVITLHDL